MQKDHSFERLCIGLFDRFAERLIYYSKMYQSFSGAVFSLSVWQLLAFGAVCVAPSAVFLNNCNLFRNVEACGYGKIAVILQPEIKIQ